MCMKPNMNSRLFCFGGKDVIRGISVVRTHFESTMATGEIPILDQPANGVISSLNQSVTDFRVYHACPHFAVGQPETDSSFTPSLAVLAAQCRSWYSIATLAECRKRSYKWQKSTKCILVRLHAVFHEDFHKSFVRSWKRHSDGGGNLVILYAEKSPCASPFLLW